VVQSQEVNEVEGKRSISCSSNRLVAFANVYADMDINNAWETIRANIKILAKGSLGYYELRRS
jgi:hypothetical protein